MPFIVNIVLRRPKYVDYAWLSAHVVHGLISCTVISDYIFSVQGILFSVVFCCRLTIKPSAIFFYSTRVAEKKSRTCLRLVRDFSAILILLTWYLEGYIKLAGIISRQWALSILCIIKVFHEGRRNFGRMRIDSSIYLFEYIAPNPVRRISIGREVQCPPKTLRIFSYLREIRDWFPTV